ncbi:metal-dependent phosphohydrolase [Actinidia rufa]|uniref:Metal-dependent phosphohydrolase n=1 Tax=Actinidia rufa TaxID=165716 RepID=A0A7J0ETA1_9ERIC|nr:metal-dependent phosphohydrolase [Actinidia rufa]
MEIVELAALLHDIGDYKYTKTYHGRRKSPRSRRVQEVKNPKHHKGGWGSKRKSKGVEIAKSIATSNLELFKMRIGSMRSGSRNVLLLGEVGTMRSMPRRLCPDPICARNST